MSYEHILALFLYTDLYVVVFYTLEFFGLAKCWELPPPPIPTAMVGTFAAFAQVV